ncbi:MAG: hypothetical protein ACRC5H_04635, partial [Treponemataceae bacterium]
GNELLKLRAIADIISSSKNIEEFTNDGFAGLYFIMDDSISTISKIIEGNKKPCSIFQKQ